MLKSTSKCYDTDKVMMKTVQGATVECNDDDTEFVSINEHYVTIKTKEGLTSIIPADKIYEIIIFPTKGNLFVTTKNAYL